MPGLGFPNQDTSAPISFIQYLCGLTLSKKLAFSEDERGIGPEKVERAPEGEAN